MLWDQVKPEVAKQEFKAKMDLKEGRMTVTVSCFHTHSDGGGRTYGAVPDRARSGAQGCWAVRRYSSPTFTMLVVKVSLFAVYLMVF